MRMAVTSFSGPLFFASSGGRDEAARNCLHKLVQYFSPHRRGAYVLNFFLAGPMGPLGKSAR